MVLVWSIAFLPYAPSRILEALEDITKRADTNSTEAYTLELTHVAVYARNVPTNETEDQDYLVPFETGGILQGSTLAPNTTLFSIPRNACNEHPDVCYDGTLSLRMIAFFTDTLFSSNDSVRGSVTSVILGDGSPLNLAQPLVFFQPQQVSCWIQPSVHNKLIDKIPTNVMQMGFDQECLPHLGSSEVLVCY